MKPEYKIGDWIWWWGPGQIIAVNGKYRVKWKTFIGLYNLETLVQYARPLSTQEKLELL